MYKVLFLVFLGALALRESYGDTSMGRCPNIPPVPDFDITKVVGYWYAIQKTSTTTPCLGYNITRFTHYKKMYKFIEMQQHQILWTDLHHQHFKTGHINVFDNSTLGKMEMGYHILDLKSTTFTVFMTDYDNYLAIFLCKNLLLVHNWSALILSRTPTLNATIVDEIRTRFSSYNIHPATFRTISHDHCVQEGSSSTFLGAS